MTSESREPLEQELDELAAELRESRGVEPSAELDARVLDAAREAAQAPAGRPVAEAWRTPFAAAASVLLCSVLYLSYPDRDSELAPDATLIDGEMVGSMPAPRAPVAASESAPQRVAEKSVTPVPAQARSTPAAPPAPDHAEASLAADPEAAFLAALAEVLGARLAGPEPAAMADAASEAAVTGSVDSGDRATGPGMQVSAGMPAEAVDAGASLRPRLCDEIETVLTARVWLLRAVDAAPAGGVCLEVPDPAQRARVEAAWSALQEEGAVDRLLREHGLDARFEVSAATSN